MLNRAMYIGESASTEYAAPLNITGVCSIPSGAIAPDFSDYRSGTGSLIKSVYKLPHRPYSFPFPSEASPQRFTSSFLLYSLHIPVLSGACDMNPFIRLCSQEYKRRCRLFSIFFLPPKSGSYPIFSKAIFSTFRVWNVCGHQTRRCRK